MLLYFTSLTKISDQNPSILANHLHDFMSQSVTYLGQQIGKATNQSGMTSIINKWQTVSVGDSINQGSPCQAKNNKFSI